MIILESELRILIGGLLREGEEGGGKMLYVDGLYDLLVGILGLFEVGGGLSVDDAFLGDWVGMLGRMDQKFDGLKGGVVVELAQEIFYNIFGSLMMVMFAEGYSDFMKYYFLKVKYDYSQSDLQSLMVVVKGQVLKHRQQQRKDKKGKKKRGGVASTVSDKKFVCEVIKKLVIESLLSRNALWHEKNISDLDVKKAVIMLDQLFNGFFNDVLKSLNRKYAGMVEKMNTEEYLKNAWGKNWKQKVSEIEREPNQIWDDMDFSKNVDEDGEPVDVKDKWIFEPHMGSSKVKINGGSI